MNPSDKPEPDDTVRPPDPPNDGGVALDDEGRKALPSAGHVDVQYKQAPPAPPGEKQIHARRPLPIIPDAPAGNK